MAGSSVLTGVARCNDGAAVRGDATTATACAQPGIAMHDV